MIKKQYRKWVALIAAIIILSFLTQVAPNLIKKVKATATAQYGQLSVKDEVEGVVLRKENVYITDSVLKMDYKVKEGYLVKAGSKLVEFSKGKQPTAEEEKKQKQSELTKSLGDSAIVMTDGVAREKGIFSTFVDGYENKFSRENYKNIAFEDLEKITVEPQNVMSEEIKKGYPVYKIIDQSEWYIAIWVDNKNLGRYEIGSNVNVYLSDKDEKPVEFKIEDISDAGKKSKILLSSNRYYEKLTSLRKVKITVETVSISGIIIENKSIVEKGDKSGVYVLSKTGEQVFTEIKILGSDGEKTAIVEDLFYNENGDMIKTVKVFDEIVSSPKK